MENGFLSRTAAGILVENVLRAAPPPPDPVNAYLSWVVYAVCGKLPEADAILRLHGGAVRRVAAGMRACCPFPSRVLHRGLLLTDADAAPGVLAAELGTESTSFTEDPDCADWFACTEASIGGAVRERKPVRGYLMMHQPSSETVLFHHTWRRVPIPGVGWIDLRMAAFIAERDGMLPETGACQFEWALRTQSEVIVEAIREPLPIQPVGALDAEQLEAKYGPPQRVYAVAK